MVDDREKKPLIFPEAVKAWIPSMSWKTQEKWVRIHTVTQRVPTGDYLIVPWESSPICIERKRDATELHANLFTNKGREKLVKEFTRMQEYPTRILLLEGDPLSYNRKNPHNPDMDPDLVRSALLHYLDLFGIQLWMARTITLPQRRATGEWVASRMIWSLEHANLDRQPVPSDERR